MKAFHGDCLEIMPTLPDKSIDCFVCDLPYGCLTGGAKKEDGCAWDVKIDLKAFWEEVKRLSRNDHTPVLMFCNTRFGAELIASNPAWFRYDLVWSKTNGVGFLSANKQPLRSHELIYVFSKKGAYYKRVDIEGDFKKVIGGITKSSVYNTVLPNTTQDNTGKRCVKSVIEISNKKGRGNHPTQKPTELYEWLLLRYCPAEGCVLDPTAGSFTSCFVAEKLGLQAIGIEKDEGFYEKANAIYNGKK